MIHERDERAVQYFLGKYVAGINNKPFGLYMTGNAAQVFSAFSPLVSTHRRHIPWFAFFLLPVKLNIWSTALDPVRFHTVIWRQLSALFCCICSRETDHAIVAPCVGITKRLFVHYSSRAATTLRRDRSCITYAITISLVQLIGFNFRIPPVRIKRVKRFFPRAFCSVSSWQELEYALLFT